MHIVEINWRAEVRILRSGEEIQATICRQQGRGESHQSFIRHKDENIIEAVTASLRVRAQNA